MKEIKAYIRPNRLDKVIRDLEQAGVPGITIVEVHPVGHGFEPNYFSRAREEIKRFFEIVKLEIVCHDEQVERFIQIILENTSTGSPGDGRIFLSPVEEAIRIRDGERGNSIL